MLLVDQVELLREHLEHLRNQRFALPLMGGQFATRQTYRFKSLLHPARDIATTIAKADPRGDRLPSRLRGWNLDATDGYGLSRQVSLKKMLGMVIHVYYLRIGEGNLDVSNDRGERVIVPYQEFLDSVERLVLTPEDACLVTCGLVDERLKNGDAIPALETLAPGAGDLAHCLATIKTWPVLQESLWTRYFADQSTTVTADCQTIEDTPFIMGAQLTGPILSWRVGWRRGDAYAQSCIEVSHLTGTIQEYFSDWPVPYEDRPPGQAIPDARLEQGPARPRDDRPTDTSQAQ